MALSPEKKQPVLEDRREGTEPPTVWSQMLENKSVLQRQAVTHDLKSARINEAGWRLRKGFELSIKLLGRCKILIQSVQIEND